METPDNNTGVPGQDQDAAAPSQSAEPPGTDPPASDTNPPGDIPPDTGIELIGGLTLVNGLLRGSVATTQPDPKVSQSPERDQSASGAATAAQAPKEKLLTLEIKEMPDSSVDHDKGLVVDISSEVTEFLPYDLEASSGWWTLKHLMEWVQFVCLTTIFVGLMASKVLESYRVWNLEGWRVCLMIYMVLAGRIVAKWVVEVVGVLTYDLLVEVIIQIKNMRSRHKEITNEKQKKNKDLDFGKIEECFDNVALVAQGMRGSTWVFLWTASLLVAWTHLFRRGKEVTGLPQQVNEDMNKVTRALVATLVGVFLWGLKTLLVRLLAWSFIVDKSETYVAASCKDQQQIVELWNLVDPDHSRSKQQQPAPPSNCTSTKSKVRFWKRALSALTDLVIGEEGMESGSGRGGRKVLKQEYDVLKNVVRDWTPTYLIRKITERELPVFVEGEKMEAKGIHPERVARATADRLFERMVKIFDSSVKDEVAHVRYIEVPNFDQNTEANVSSKEVQVAEMLQKVIPPVPLHPKGCKRFRRSDFRKWMIKVYTERLVLIRVISGRDNVIGELNRTLSCVAALIILFVWLVIMRSLTVQVMISMITFLGTLKFIFDDTAKTAFEAIMFVFVTRPFDVGHRCNVGENEMIVHDMNILSTIFKQADGQMLYYPNSALIKRTIMNCRSGHEDRAGTVEFKVDDSALASDSIYKLRDEIEEYMEKKNKIWNTEKCKMKFRKRESLLTLSITHRANFYNGGDKKMQTEELVEKIKKSIKNLSVSKDQSVM